MNNFDCPYCQSLNKGSFPSYILDEPNTSNKIETFTKSSFLQKCVICKEEYYIGMYFLQYASNGRPVADICVTAMTKEAFKEFKTNHFNKMDLLKYLPEEKEVRDRYKDLVRCFENNDSDRQKLFNIRSVIEAYLVFYNDVETAHNLHKQVDKLSLDDNVKELFKYIIRECVNAIHVKREIANINPNKAFKFIEIIFTNEFKLSEEKKQIEQSYQEKRDELNLELVSLINNF